MKRKFLYAVIAALVALPGLTKAQSPAEPVIYSNWEMLIESTTLIDISYRVIKCETTPQVHLMIFNENSIDQTAHFEIEISNGTTGEKFTKEINFAAKKATVFKALCESDSSLDPLKINLPANYDPGAIKIKITFKS